MNFENVFPLSNDFVTTVEIYNKKLFRQVCNALINKDCLEDEFEPFVLVNEAYDKEMSAENIITITDVRDFDMDNKNVLTAVNDRLKGFINTNDEASHALSKISYDIYKLLMTLSNEFECDFIVSEKTLDISKILKLYQFTVEDPDTDWFDKLLNIITLYADLFPEKVLCFFNLKLWLDLEEIDCLINHIVGQKIRVLLVESTENSARYSKEYKVIIDDDFVETLIKTNAKSG